MIIQSDNGTLFKLTIKDDTGIVDLSNAQVKVKLKNGDFVNVIECDITNPSNGECQFTLSSTDTIIGGIYQYQLTVTFDSGKEFSSEIKKINISRKL